MTFCKWLHVLVLSDKDDELYMLVFYFDICGMVQMLPQVWDIRDGVVYPYPSYEHCTDEAQKAETELSAVTVVFIHSFPRE